MKKGGEIVFEDLWRIYRQDIGKGDYEYGIFHDEEYFASTKSLPIATRILKAMQVTYK